MVDVKYHEDIREAVTIQRFDTTHWEVKITEEASKDLKKKLEKMVDKREDWPRALYEFVIRKMAFVIDKEGDLDLSKIDFEDTVIGVCDEWKKRVGMRTMSKQKSIKEAVKDNRGKVSPGKKKK